LEDRKSVVCGQGLSILLQWQDLARLWKMRTMALRDTKRLLLFETHLSVDCEDWPNPMCPMTQNAWGMWRASMYRDGQGPS
jgi:hypothetical protein